MRFRALAFCLFITGTIGALKASETAPSPEYRPWAFLVGGVWTLQLPSAPDGTTRRMERAYSWAKDQPGVLLEGIDYKGGKAVDRTSAVIAWNSTDHQWHATGTSALGVTSSTVFHTEGAAIVEDTIFSTSDGSSLPCEGRMEVSGDAGSFQLFRIAQGAPRKLLDVKMTRAGGALGLDTVGADEATAMLVRATKLFPRTALERIDRMGREVVPPAVVSQPAPHYPFLDRVVEKQGLVWVGFIVGPSGDVTDAKVLADNDPKMAKAAIEGVRRWKFRPGEVDGQPQEFLVTIPVRFRLPRDSLKG